MKDLLNCLGFGAQMYLQKIDILHQDGFLTLHLHCFKVIFYHILVGQSMVVCHGLVSYELGVGTKDPYNN